MTAFGSVVEKPVPNEAVGTLANISRYFLPAELIQYPEAIRPDPRNGEYHSITALADFARTNPVLIHTISGAYHDCGSADGLLKANERAVSVAVRSSCRVEVEGLVRLLRALATAFAFRVNGDQKRCGAV